MRLSFSLGNLAALLSMQAREAGSAVTLAALIERLKEAAQLAYQLEAGVRSGPADVVAFAKSGEPRPSAEVIDLAEIFGRERVSRLAPEETAACEVVLLPVVQHHHDGGDAA